MARLGLVLLAVLSVSCVSSRGSLFPIDFEFIDVPDERRIELRYRNELAYTVCLLPEFWPNKAGKIDQASGQVFLVVGDQRFAIEEFNTGYCPDCSLRVGPGEIVEASIGYDAFSLPESLVTEEKHLEFVPKAYRCRPKAE